MRYHPYRITIFLAAALLVQTPLAGAEAPVVADNTKALARLQASLDDVTRELKDTGSRLDKLEAQVGRLLEETRLGANAARGADFDVDSFKSWAEGYFRDAAVETLVNPAPSEVARRLELFAFKTPALSAERLVAEFEQLELDASKPVPSPESGPTRTMAGASEDFSDGSRARKPVEWKTFFEDLRRELVKLDFDSSRPEDWQTVATTLAEVLVAVPQVLEERVTREPGIPRESEQRLPRVVELPQRSRPVAWLILVAGLVFLSVAVFWVTTRGETSIVHDSPDFKDALGVWHPVIAGCCHTPRAIKRFTNRVRFFAMRQRSQSDEPSHWQYVLGRIRGWLGYETPKVILPAEAGRISEPLLVGLCALARSDTVWLDHTDAWRWLHEGIVSGSPPAGMDPGYCDCVRECIGQHQSRFGEFAPTEEQRATLQTMFGEAKNLGD